MAILQINTYNEQIFKIPWNLLKPTWFDLIFAVV